MIFKQPTSLTFEAVALPEPWHAFRAKASFPLSAEARALAHSFFSHLSRALEQNNHLHASLWLDAQELHRDGGSRIFSQHARPWSPVMGFAFDPAGPAPRTLEFSDLADATFGTPPKIFDRSAIFVSSAKATHSAYELLAGRGLATLLFFREDAPNRPEITQAVERFMQKTRATLEPMMASDMFRHYPFYLPLLSSTGIASASAQQLGDWLDGVEVLWRENFEDGELLLLSRLDLKPALTTALQACGLVLAKSDSKIMGWTLPAQEAHSS